MKERSILFSGAMVQAILDDRKAQTRRAVKPQPDAVHDTEPYWNIGGYRAFCFRGINDPLRMGSRNPLVCPYGQSGDRLWVRESFNVGWLDGGRVLYRADGGLAKDAGYPGEPQWKPSIHMPRWASRITLEIAEVRVQRLQDISEEDSLAEGCSINEVTERDLADLAISDESPLVKELGKKLGPGSFAARCDFAMLWDSLNGVKCPWHSNPWVWAISFERISAEAKAA